VTDSVVEGQSVELPGPADLVALVGLGLAIGFVLRPLARAAGRWAYPRPALRVAPLFTWRDGALLALVWIGMQLALGPLFIALDLDLEAASVAFPATVLVFGVMSATVLARVYAQPRGLASLGLRPKENGWAVLYAVFQYGGALPFLIALMVLNPLVLEHVLGLDFAPQKVGRMIAEAQGAEIPIVLVCAVVLIPLCEEFLFRGFLQNSLEGALGPRGAVALSSFFFAALHGVSAALPIFGLSLVLGHVMLHTRRLSACWAVHALHNGSTTALLFLLPDQFFEG